MSDKVSPATVDDLSGVRLPVSPHFHEVGEVDRAGVAPTTSRIDRADSTPDPRYWEFYMPNKSQE